MLCLTSWPICLPRQTARRVRHTGSYSPPEPSPCCGVTPLKCHSLQMKTCLPESQRRDCCCLLRKMSPIPKLRSRRVSRSAERLSRRNQSQGKYRCQRVPEPEAGRMQGSCGPGGGADVPGKRYELIVGLQGHAEWVKKTQLAPGGKLLQLKFTIPVWPGTPAH